jgi:hypothetical protein
MKEEGGRRKAEGEKALQVGRCRYYVADKALQILRLRYYVADKARLT